ncbi:MAG: hypothetical protein KF891_02875 [Rhizobacter sp.]|nr:hypothetical protein [Rhizobacter sp.]
MQDRNELLNKLQSTLIRWNGSSAQLKELTEGHKKLKLFLQHPQQSGFLLVECVDPIHIQAPIAWPNARLQVSLEEGNEFLVRDEAADVRIRAGLVEAKEFD